MVVTQGKGGSKSGVGMSNGIPWMWGYTGNQDNNRIGIMRIRK